MREDCTQNNVVIDEFDIATWYSEGSDRPFIAVNMTAALNRLAKFPLSDDEKKDVCMLMAGYCHLVDGCGAVGCGDTEFEAIADLFGHAVLE